MGKFLLDPKAPGAFSSDVMHKVVLNGIDFELPDDIWDAIDDALCRLGARTVAVDLLHLNVVEVGHVMDEPMTIVLINGLRP